MHSQPSLPAQPEDSPASVVADANVSLGGVGFAQLILNALHGQGNIKAQSMSNDNEVREKPAQLSEDDLYSIPFNAAEMLEHFFNFRHCLAPVFHVPTVRPLCERAIRCRPEERSAYRSTLIILNMIFAVCTSHWLIVSEDTVANHRAARRHYDIAMTLMQPNLLRDWSLEHVQALLIGARYLQSSSCADECWNVLGLAIRIAYGLCLHREPPETDPPPLRETRRRVWYAAYTLDRLMSTVYERPAAIRSVECPVQLPEDLDDDCIRADGMLYPMPRRPTAMTFSIEVVKLYRIMEALAAGLTGDVQNSKKTAQLASSLHETYRRWHRALPPCLVLDYNNPQEQPWILALRGNMVRILIHRQSLAITLRGLAGPQEMEDVAITKSLQQSRTICINAAIETVDIVALRHEETKKTLGLNWFNIYYCRFLKLLPRLANPMSRLLIASSVQRRHCPCLSPRRSPACQRRDRAGQGRAGAPHDPDHVPEPCIRSAGTLVPATRSRLHCSVDGPAAEAEGRGHAWPHIPTAGIRAGPGNAVLRRGDPQHECLFRPLRRHDQRY